MTFLTHPNKVENTQDYSIAYDQLLSNSEEILKDVDSLLDKADVSKAEYEGRTYTYSRGGPAGWLDYKNAAEKAWTALYQAIDVLLHNNNIKSQHGGRTEHDREMPDRPILGNYDRYVSITAGLRNNSNYYTKQDIELVKWEVSRIKDLINELK